MGSQPRKELSKCPLEERGKQDLILFAKRNEARTVSWLPLPATLWPQEDTFPPRVSDKWVNCMPFWPYSHADTITICLLIPSTVMNAHDDFRRKTLTHAFVIQCFRNGLYKAGYTACEESSMRRSMMIRAFRVCWLCREKTDPGRFTNWPLTPS